MKIADAAVMTRRNSVIESNKSVKIGGKVLANHIMREFDFSPVKYRLRLENKVTRDANELQSAFCQWFSMFPLLKPHDVYVMLFDDIDEFFHTLLIHTELYDEFCQRYLGYKVHHHPLGESTPESVEAGIPATIELLENEFGEELHEYLQEWKYKFQAGAVRVSCGWSCCPNGHISSDVEGNLPNGVLVIH